MSGQRFPWGSDTITHKLANYYGLTSISYDLGPDGYNAIGSIGGIPYSSPVGTFAANGYGLNDMAGNVWEWCWDWHGTPYAGGSDPHGPLSGSSRVYRGGGCFSYANYCRAAYRNYSYPAGADHSTGFRLARSFVPVGFALIPAGSFLMGDQSNPLVGGPNELPVHSVQMSAFYMGKHEVTKGEWDVVRTWGLANGYTDLPVGYYASGLGANNYPVHSITWYAMVKWCNARSQKERLTPCYTVSGATYKTGDSDAVVCNWNADGYRLPTEAEWEKAARGGLSAQNFPWGDTISHSQANYYRTPFSYDVSPTQFYHPIYGAGTSPVGSFTPNGYGLYDMAGNVVERCWDWYGSYSAGSQTDPHGPASGSYRVSRGGGWHNSAFSCRAANRISINPDYSGNYFGFRTARSLAP